MPPTTFAATVDKQPAFKPASVVSDVVLIYRSIGERGQYIAIRPRHHLGHRDERNQSRQGAVARHSSQLNTTLPALSVAANDRS